MPLEVDVATVVRARCPRVFPVFAPVETARPYVTYQLIGGVPMRYVDASAADKRAALVQVDVWDDTHAGALALLRQIEDDLCTSVVVQARPVGEARTEAEPAITRYGASQDFEVVAQR